MLSGAVARPALSAIRFSLWGIWIVTAPGLSSGLGGGFGFERADRVVRDVAQTFAAIRSEVRDNFAAHPRIPETPQMLSSRSYGVGPFGVRGFEGFPDLIGHRDQMMDVHRRAFSIGTRRH